MLLEYQIAQFVFEQLSSSAINKAIVYVYIYTFYEWLLRKKQKKQLEQ